MRRNGNDCVLAAVNRGSDVAEIQVDSAKTYSPILGEAPINGAWRIEPLGYSLLEIK